MTMLNTVEHFFKIWKCFSFNLIIRLRNVHSIGLNWVLWNGLKVNHNCREQLLINIESRIFKTQNFNSNVMSDLDYGCTICKLSANIKKKPLDIHNMMSPKNNENILTKRQIELKLMNYVLWRFELQTKEVEVIWKRF